PAQEKLLDTLKEVSPGLNVAAILTTVKEGISYFATSPPIDIIFCDVQLPDGLSFEIFSETRLKIPVIFITGFDKFMLYAFENNGIDYLLKPVDKEELKKALYKYKMLEDHFADHIQSVYNLVQTFNVNKKTRLLVKKGVEHISLKIEDVALFYTENKIVYVIDKSGKKFTIDKTLNELETDLDKKIFFRVNRQYIVNLSFVKSYRSYEKVKLQLDLVVPNINHFIVISQITASHFRRWIAEEV
ncbi:MAG: LytTR family DNA-binding domain-containing protein, partial [Ginsengibacter sp.]